MLELLKDPSLTNLRIACLQTLREVYVCFVKFPQLEVTKSEYIVDYRSVWV